MIPFFVSLALYITTDTGNMAIFLFKGLPNRVRVVQTLYFNGFQWVQTVDQWLIGKSLRFFELDKAGFQRGISLVVVGCVGYIIWSKIIRIRSAETTCFR